MGSDSPQKKKEEGDGDGGDGGDGDAIETEPGSKRDRAGNKYTYASMSAHRSSGTLKRRANGNGGVARDDTDVTKIPPSLKAPSLKGAPPVTDDETSSSSSSSSHSEFASDGGNANAPRTDDGRVRRDSRGGRAATTTTAAAAARIRLCRRLLPWTGAVVWPLMLLLPLILNHTSTFHYSAVFPRAWYAMDGRDWLVGGAEEESTGGGVWEWGTRRLYPGGGDDGGKKPLRHPLGLSLGIAAVAVGQLFLQVYFRLHQQQRLGRTTPIQSRGAVEYDYASALRNHLSQPGGFLMLGLYLGVTWIFDMLPPSYYSFGTGGGIQYGRVFLCLVCQDFVQHVMHRLEHVAHPRMYRISHKPHHRFTNPKLFDAFDGSVPDTAVMILIPLFVTAHVVRDCNVWTYMAFGSTYANWLTLIHSEVSFPWEVPIFRALGLGTAADHHVHHKFFRYNFGHLFMWFDWLAGTYRDPREVWGKEFNVGV